MGTDWFVTWGRRGWGATRPGERLAEAGIDSYRSELRSLVRGLWAGVIKLGDFIGDALSAIDRAGTAAWNEGAARAGIKPDELSDEERFERERFYWDHYIRVPNFARDIEAGSKANGGKLETQLARVELWVNQYNGVVVKAQMMANADQKLEWVLGPTEEHCRDCATYAGRVYRASTWMRYGIQPQSPQLACHGFRCQCRLEPTDAPANKGRPPAMTG